jgi:predicted transcriptional regulator
MSQDSVLKFLRRHRKWRTTEEIANKVGVQKGCALNSLNSLFKYNEVLRKEGWLRYRRGYLWRCK